MTGKKYLPKITIPDFPCLYTSNYIFRLLISVISVTDTKTVQHTYSFGDFEDGRWTIVVRLERFQEGSESLVFRLSVGYLVHSISGSIRVRKVYLSNVKTPVSRISSQSNSITYYRSLIWISLTHLGAC